MKAGILALLGAVAVFGSSITGDLTETNAIDFNPGTPDTLTFPEGELAGTIPPFGFAVTWVLSGATFDYTVSGTTATITSGGPITFTLSAESDADQLAGAVNLTSMSESGNSAVVDGTLTLTTVDFGGPSGATYESELAAQAGLASFSTGETFSLQVDVQNCFIPGGGVTACFGGADPVGSADLLTLTPSGVSTPEPGTFLLGAFALTSLGALRFRRRPRPSA
jgi:uncharacterized protein (TIGR03382 family)